MHDKTSILNAARELVGSSKDDTYNYCIKDRVINLPKRKSFFKKNDIVLELMSE